LDWQTAINLGAAVCIAVVGFIARRGVKVADDLVNFRIEVAKEYVTHIDLREIKDSLIRIEATLAAKQDRH
jgi:hypothetical protein